MSAGNGEAERARNPWRLLLSWSALLWERLWPALWPALGIAGLFVLLGLLDILPSLPGWLHLAVVVAFAAAIAVVLWRDLRRLSLPGLGAARRRLERVNALPHRPLQALDDQLAGGTADPEASSLWALHQARMRAAVERLRVGFPSPRLLRRDPLALRIGLGVALLLAATVAGDDAMSRIDRAMRPQVSLLGPTHPAMLDAWITPPEYTRQPPIFLGAAKPGQAAAPESSPESPSVKAQSGHIAVPAGSVFVARVSGGRGVPHFSLGKARTEFVKDQEGSYRIERVLDAGGALRVTQSRRELAAWQVDVVPDKPPTVGFKEDPGQTQRGVLRLDYQAGDDYGLAKVVATIRRVAPQGTADDGDTLQLQLPLSGSDPREAAGTSYHDLTPHPWAGLPVEIQLHATDTAGQTGESKAIRAILPERIFNHPVARAVVAERKRLVADPEQNAYEVIERLGTIAWHQDLYDNDFVVFLALSSAARRLVHSGGEAVAEVQQLLWNTALRIEDGRLSIAARTLRQMEQALRDALSRNASDAELERLLDQLQAAMDAYFDSMAEMMQGDEDREMEMARPDPNALTLNRDDFKKMLDEIRKLTRSGARDAARQMLSQLQSMLENLQAARPAPPNAEGRRAMDTLNRLQGLIQQQQQLLDKTFREAQRRGQQQATPPGFWPPDAQRRPPGNRQSGPQQGNPPGNGQQEMQGQNGQQFSGESAQTQEQLRRQLGELMRQLGEMSGNIPRPFGQAERSMRDSRQALEQGQPGQAIDPQGQAIDQLQQGARMATEQLMQQLGQGRGHQPGGQQQSFGDMNTSFDPFGRPMTSGSQGLNNSDVKIPQESELQRARQIRDELRRRAGQRDRPPVERDYIERLLRQF